VAVATLPGTIFNAGPHARAEVAAVPAAVAAAAQPETAQVLADGSVAVYTEVPGSGATQLSASPVPAAVTVSGNVIDNGLVRVTLDEAGLLASVRDLVAGREVLAPGARGNLLRLHADLPNHWDAWDLDRHYKHQYTDLTDVDSITVVDSGPLVGAVRIERSVNRSRIVQTVRVTAGSRRVDIETEIDWHETEKILKATFPLDVHADRCAAEIQFGHVFRPTHTNTSWDAARFEVSCHRWVHVGEPGYGVAVVNDSTYGYDVGRNTRDDGGTTTTVRLSLVRAPRSPDPEADQGRHRMTYALLAGAGIDDAVAAGYALNLPLRAGSGPSGPSAPPLVSVDGVAATVESVKLADDRSGDVIVRLYESLGGRADTRVRTGFVLAAAEAVDLLERPLGQPLPVDGDGAVPIRLRPFQVLTLRLRRR